MKLLITTSKTVV